jgi:hypothetical protein
MDTWQLEFNTVGDLTSKCMPPLVFKFAQKAVSDRASGVYLCNMMPKRMQIVRARGRGSNGFGTIVSTDQTKAPFAYWAEEMRRILNSHRGHVLVLLGSANRDTYAKWVRGRLVDADPISCPETAGSERVAAWFEYDTVSDQRRIRRVVLAVMHPEHCLHLGHDLDKPGVADTMRCSGFMERLLDLANIYAGEVSTRPALLSSTNWSHHFGCLHLISLHELVNFDTGIIAKRLVVVRLPEDKSRRWLGRHPVLAASVEDLIKLHVQHGARKTRPDAHMVMAHMPPQVVHQKSIDTCRDTITLIGGSLLNVIGLTGGSEVSAELRTRAFRALQPRKNPLEARKADFPRADEVVVPRYRLLIHCYLSRVCLWLVLAVGFRSSFT